MGLKPSHGLSQQLNNGILQPEMTAEFFFALKSNQNHKQPQNNKTEKKRRKGSEPRKCYNEECDRIVVKRNYCYKCQKRKERSMDGRKLPTLKQLSHLLPIEKMFTKRGWREEGKKESVVVPPPPPHFSNTKEAFLNNTNYCDAVLSDISLVPKPCVASPSNPIFQVPPPTETITTDSSDISITPQRFDEYLCETRNFAREYISVPPTLLTIGSPLLNLEEQRTNIQLDCSDDILEIPLNFSPLSFFPPFTNLEEDFSNIELD
jgi:hypothetical protein